ncbi:MAG: RNA-binding S4 domain-containing protein [Pseudomonadota bacterium]
MDAAPEKLRLDKWLWYARFFKTRSLAAALVGAGKVRVNGTPTSKRAATVAAGDVLTFPKEKDIRVIRIEALGTRRGPAPEAQALYTDLSPPTPRAQVPRNPAFDGKGKPSKKERRQLDLSRNRHLE